MRATKVDIINCLRVAELPAHHKDPFDRILVARARVDGMHFITADRLVLAYDLPVIWAQPRKS